MPGHRFQPLSRLQYSHFSSVYKLRGKDATSRKADGDYRGPADLRSSRARGIPAAQLYSAPCPDPLDAEDILQDVFFKLVEANRLLMPIEHVTGWLFSVARNRITDLLRKKKPESFGDREVHDENEERLNFEDLLPSPDAGPEALFARNVLSRNSNLRSRNCRRSSARSSSRTSCKGCI